MSSLDVLIQDGTHGPEVLVGTLTRTASRSGDVIAFEYVDSWLNRSAPTRAFPLDTELQLAPGRMFSQAGAAELTGAFQDCSPDRWGKLLMKRREAIEAREQGRAPRPLRPWDYLIGVNDESRMGAIRLRDQASGAYLDTRVLSAPPITELRSLEAIAWKLQQGEELTDETAAWFKQLVEPGASLGGARPKSSFRDVDGSLWLAKFPSTDDTVDVGLWEHVTSILAGFAGVRMPDAKVMKLSKRGHTFAVRRFDRTDNSRRVYASAMTMLGATESEGRSYLDIADVIEREGVPAGIARDLEQLFRRALFGVLIGNRDDHLRNHGFLRDPQGWSLSPAFDVNPNLDKQSHVLNIGAGLAAPESALLIAEAQFYRIGKHQLGEIIDEVRGSVSDWEAVAKRAGAKAAEIEQMRSVIDPRR